MVSRLVIPALLIRISISPVGDNSKAGLTISASRFSIFTSPRSTSIVPILPSDPGYESRRNCTVEAGSVAGLWVKITDAPASYRA
ncbi:hypothetical protein OGATHE_003190 [Ogataea polymorpha]|uniref:Uncharacterized protein n=1 Tax=Ogataea polymorpha TaxID=460523 RepID=A0A9P8P955_9ASCO|nr:hypothetical protein OGATHE_003190 [Ogataea polymorpha]